MFNIRVLLADDHFADRERIKHLINSDPRTELVREVTSVVAACRFVDMDAPDLVIVGLVLRNGPGFDLISWLRLNRPEQLILVLSDDEEYAERMLRRGVHACVTKAAAERDLLDAIQKVHRGVKHLSPSLSDRLVSKMVRGKAWREEQDVVSAFTTRELNVFRLVAEGASTKEVAERLNISAKTVEGYRKRMREKLNLHSQRELVQYAGEWLSNLKNKRFELTSSL